MSTQTSDIVHEEIEDRIEENQFLTEQDQESEDPLQVRRSYVLMDSISIIRFTGDDLHSTLGIEFMDEKGVDLGGLRRGSITDGGINWKRAAAEGTSITPTAIPLFGVKEDGFTEDYKADILSGSLDARGGKFTVTEDMRQGRIKTHITEKL
ncbi:unnamed protein product [Mytilus coruscus]|uniref:Uncharacterized protein n=1 Tax=Mytilus coruscus TaxID=42192 RepID=A0A6J8DXI1_MYTCO|nr:unnamed protein product [Mytilus coruscus]